MDGPSYAYLMIFYFSVSICGRTEGTIPSCQARLMVRRGMTLRAAPHQHVTVNCPVKLCDESWTITWCKIQGANICEPMKDTENVKIRQAELSLKIKQLSSLTFKRISAKDDGLYRCQLKGSGYEAVSHNINVSVSDSHLESAHTAAEQSLAAAGDAAQSWLPYLFICGGFALMVLILSALTLSFRNWKQIRTLKSAWAKEVPSRKLPDLPKRSAPSTPVMFGPDDL